MCTGSHPFIPALNTAKVDIVQTLDSQAIVNSFYFQTAGGWSESDIRNLADAASDAWALNVLPVQSQDIEIALVRATDISVDNSWQTENNDRAGEAGSLAMESLPGGSALAVKFTTGHAGRSFRGRSYFAGIPKLNVTVNEVDGDYRTDVVEAYQSFITSVNTAMDSVHVVASYCQEGSWLDDAQLTPITGYGADVNIDSQRRRLTGRGI